MFINENGQKMPKNAAKLILFTNTKIVENAA